MGRYKVKTHWIGGTRDWEARIVVGRGSVPRQILGTIADVQCSIGPGSQVDGTRVGYTTRSNVGNRGASARSHGNTDGAAISRRSEQSRWLGYLTTRVIEKDDLYRRA